MSQVLGPLANVTTPLLGTHYKVTPAPRAFRKNGPSRQTPGGDNCSFVRAACACSGAGSRVRRLPRPVRAHRTGRTLRARGYRLSPLRQLLGWHNTCTLAQHNMAQHGLAPPIPLVFVIFNTATRTHGAVCTARHCLVCNVFTVVHSGLYATV